MEKLSFVIPCYRSEHTIGAVVDEIVETVTAHGGYDYEIILVNDNSPDNVMSVIKSIARENTHVRGLDLSRNFGQHSAIMAGFTYLTGDIVVCLDDDGQTPACEMFKLIDKLDSYDLVFAEYKDKHHSGFRNFGSKVNDKMACWLLSKPKDLQIMSYFACKRYVIDEVLRYTNPYPYMSGLLLRATKKVTNVEVHHHDRVEGQSGYSIKKLLLLWINGFTSFSVKPLRFATFIGFITAMVGFLYGIYVIINQIVNPYAPLGYGSTMAVLLFIGGMIMLMLGMVGEYVGRVYLSINRSPQFVIRDKVGFEDKKDGARKEEEI